MKPDRVHINGSDWCTLFEERHGPGAYERLLDDLRQPCVTFATIAKRLGVTRERVRQWQMELLPDAPIKDIVWLAVPGPGGGGGGGGNKMPDPPRKAELPGKEKITVPVAEKPKPVPDPPKPETPPEPVSYTHLTLPTIYSV